MSSSRWKWMAGLLTVSLGGLATVAGQCPKPDANKGSKNPIELAMASDVPAIPGPTPPASSAKMPPAPAPAITEAPSAGPMLPALPSAQPVEMKPVAPVLPAGPATPPSPSIPTQAFAAPEVPALPLPGVFPSSNAPVQETRTKKHEEKPASPVMPTVAPTVDFSGGSLLLPAPPVESVKPTPVTPAPVQSAVPPPPIASGNPASSGLAPVPAAGSGKPSFSPIGNPVPPAPLTPPVAAQPEGPPPFTPPPAVSNPAHDVIPASNVSTPTSKFRIVLRVGEGEPTFEVRSGDDLLMKVLCEKVDIKSPEKVAGPSVVKAMGKVRFTGFGAEGSCDELTFLAGTGEVDMVGHVKIHVKDRLGRVESELSTETMKYKIDPSATGAIKP